jgi:hypothetical protein
MEITHCQYCRKPLNQHDDLVCIKWRQLYSQLLNNKGWIPKITK